MYILLGIIVLLILTIILIYNHLVKMDIRCKNAWSQIDNQLKRRHDLIPNLIEVTKGYAKHESETLEKVTAMRTGNTLSEIAENSELVSKNLKDLFMVAEGYPDLKANTNFIQLQRELTETEDRISLSRQIYNDTVLTYNNKVQMVPSNIVAGMFGFKKGIFFEASEADKKTPEVKF